MNQIESINLSLSAPWYIFFAGIVIAIGLTIFMYRYTLPPISKMLKVVLITIRSLAMISLLFLIFEPVLIINSSETTKPVNLLFIDNSKSIILKDSASRSTQINRLVENLVTEFGDNNLVYTFGGKIDSLNTTGSSAISFTEPVTDFSQIFDKVSASGLNTASVVIVSDGVITDGITPVNEAEKLGVPVYTIGVGDTTAGKDIRIKDIQFNKYVYAEKSTKIKAAITNTKYSGKSILASLLKGANIIDQKKVILREDGLNEIEFDYKPERIGNNKLSIQLSVLPDEQSAENNKKVFYINVLKSKLNLLIVAGSPSPDVSFIKNSLMLDDNLQVESLIEITGNRFVTDNSYKTKLDSADMLYLIGFPGINSSPQFVDDVYKVIAEKRKPFFLSLGNGISISKLKMFENALPFRINNQAEEFVPAQITIADETCDLIKYKSGTHISAWNQLPPVGINKSDFLPKAGIKTIAVIKQDDRITQTPMLMTGTNNPGRCIALLAKDIWRWKLKSESRSILFDTFFANSVKWLNTNMSQKRVNISTSKLLYQPGEEIQFNAQVYDEMFNPLNNADINVTLVHSNNKTTIKLLPGENGFYSGKTSITDKGDYTYTATAYINNQIIGTEKGNFNVGDIDVEASNPVMNRAFLFLLSTLTNGKYCYINDHEELTENIKHNLDTSINKINVSKKNNLWSSELFLILLIILFSLEWILRKKVGMI